MESATASAVARDRLVRHAALTPVERTAIVLQMREDGLASFMLTQGLDRPTAVRRVKALHRMGRRPSACAIGRED